MSFQPASHTLQLPHSAVRLWCCLLLIWALLAWGAKPSHAQFGLSSDANYYRVDTGAGLVFKVRRVDSGSSTQSIGDLASLVFNGVEYQNQSRGSQINSGFDWLYNGQAAPVVSAAVVNTDYIKVTVLAGNLTHYYLARRGYSHIYMATYFTQEPDVHGHCRYIVRIPSNLLPNGPVPSDIRNNTGAIESGDVFGMANGETRSKHYSNQRLIDWTTIGATGNNVGVWLVRDNQEGGSGGPFYRSLLNQCGSDQEITYIINYAQGQTEPFRPGVLNGPYLLIFNSGGTPSTNIDTSWVADMGLTGYISASARGYVNGKATGVPAGFAGVVGFANSTAQYWTRVNNSNFYSPAMIPGTYIQTLYKGELAVATKTVTVTAGATPVTSHIASNESNPIARWRIGEWDGTPAGFLNADKVTTMHPSDVRMSPWGPVTYTVGSSTPNQFPAYQWKAVNNPTTVKFDLTANQLSAHTLRVGLTCAFEGGRPQITLNSWTSAIPAASSQPDTRTLTTGSYRGNNTTYTYNIPASAFVAGTNTLTLTVVSGSGSTGFLSAGYSYDCVELDAPWNGTFRLTPQHAQDKALTVTNADPSNGAGTEISTYQGAAQQQFILDQQTDGTYRIQTALTGNRCLELPFGNAANGTPIKLWDDNGNNAQRWSIVPISGPWHKIVPKNDATKCMDVNGGPGATADGTPVQSWDYLGAANQLWRLTPVSEDVFVSLNSAAYTVAENAGSATITVQRTGNTSLPVSVDYSTADGTATQPGEYTATTGTLEFLAGESTKSFTIPIIDDFVDDANTALTVNLSNVTGGAILRGQTSATVTIQDNDDLPRLSINDAAVVEGHSGTRTLTFTVTASLASQKTVTVNYATANGSATAGSDYAAKSGTLTFSPGQTSKTIEITINGDVTIEAVETLLVNLSGPANAALADSQGVGTITSDDNPFISIADLSVLEGSSGSANAVFTVKLSTASPLTVTVNYATANSTAVAGVDYTNTSGKLTIAPGNTTGTITVPINPDTLDELDEAFALNLSTPTNATLPDAQALCTITDDDLPPAISINSVTLTESNPGSTPDLNFTVTLSVASTRMITVEYTTAGGTAIANTDFSTRYGRIAFSPGTRTRTISVPITGDLLDEATETFTVNLSAPVNASLANAQGTGTILDNDAPPSIKILAANVAEGNSGTRTLSLVVNLSAPSGQNVTVDFATADGTAVAGADYTASTGTLTFLPGQVTRALTVPVLGDTSIESHETVDLTLSNPGNATIHTASAAGTITNDDFPTVRISDATVIEGDAGTAPLTFTVSLSSPAPQAMSVAFATENNTALAGQDYLAKSGTLSFAAGESSKTVAVTVLGDTTVESHEMLIVRLSSPLPTQVKITDPQGSGIIMNNDTANAALSSDGGEANTVSPSGGIDRS